MLRFMRVHFASTGISLPYSSGASCAEVLEMDPGDLGTSMDWWDGDVPGAALFGVKF